jgi:hypothetical protein
VKKFVKNFYDVDDPMWVIGCIDSHGAIVARHATSGGNIMHGSSESRGKRWRWNIWRQEFFSTLRGRLDELTEDEHSAVVEWLERRGYKKVDE